MSTDLNPRESYGQLFFLDNTIESLEGTIDIQIGLATSTADLVLNRNVLLARGKTLSLEDHAAPYNRVALSMVDGVLVVGSGGLGLRVGNIEIYQNTIESTAGDVQLVLGNINATANLLINRNVVMGEGKTITGGVAGGISSATHIQFDTDHVPENEPVGTLYWNVADDTLNIQHTGGITQQVGQEQYVRVSNSTGSTITNGSVVRFDGALLNGEAYLEVAPFQANGVYPSLYAVGIATQDIADGVKGYVTVFGKVRGLNTTGGAENWAMGDILYANPDTAGGLTKVKPTAPNNVVPVAAVLRVSATVGELFVRPTIEQKYSYGRFSRTTDFTFGANNTAYAITLDTTQISNGVTRAVTTSRITVDQSGYYAVDASVQLDTTSNKGVCYLWLRKNGDNVAGTTRREAIESADDNRCYSYHMEISLAAGDYIELCTAATSSDLRFDASAATAFAPTTAAVLISVNQIVL